MSKSIVFFIFFVLIGACAWGFTSEVTETQPFALFFDDETPVSVSESQAQIEFLLGVPQKHHLYQDKIRIEFENSGLTQDVVMPDGVIKYDEFAGEETSVYEEGDYTIVAKLKFSSDFDYTKPLIGKISYQGCSDKICFRATKQNFAFTLSNPATLKSLSSHSPDDKKQTGFFELLRSNDFKTILEHGLPLALILTFLAGVITAFTPCVLPVIPLTLAFIGVAPHQQKKKRLKALAIFVLGLCLMYSTLGVLSAILGKTFGFIFQSQIFLIFLTLFFLAMGLWMLGLLNFNLPSDWQTKIAQVSPKGNFRYLYAGLTIGFLAAPCVGPIIGPLLVYIAATQNIGLGFMLMMSYSLGLSVLFFILGFFSRNWIGRFGQKSLWVKKVLGMLLVGTSVFYGGIFIKPYFNQDVAKETFFQSDLDASLKQAQKEGKGVLVDFYADWCLPCQEWIAKVWSDKTAQEKISQNFIPVKIDCTKETKACEEAVSRYGIIGWPTIVFVGKDQKEVSDKRIVGMVMSAKEFIRYIDKVGK